MKFLFSLFALIALSAEECCAPIPNLSARFNADCSSFDLFADLIFWTAREASADCWAEHINLTPNTSTNDLLGVDFGWDPGFRVGVGYGMKRDEWDTRIYYTWFHTEGDDSISGLPGTVHSSFTGNFYVSNPSGLGLSGPSYQSAHIDWTIQYNVFDWELGRNFWVSRSLAIRPFMGAKGGWIHQSMDSTWEHPTFDGAQFVNPQPFNIGEENVKNNFWGLGPCIGINTKWNLYAKKSHHFNLLGDVSCALMWGHWTFRDGYNNDAGQTITVGSDNINSGAATICSFLGFGWDICLSRSRFSTKFGFESQFWMDQLQYYSFTGGRLSNELTLQGGTLEFSFDF